MIPSLVGVIYLVSYLRGIGKGKALKILNASHTLIKLGRHDAQMADVFSEATKFIGACYGFRVDGSKAN